MRSGGGSNVMWVVKPNLDLCKMLINFGSFTNSIRNSEKCLLSNDIYDYYNVSQGKITIPSMDDGEESTLTDVSER